MNNAFLDQCIDNIIEDDMRVEPFALPTSLEEGLQAAERIEERLYGGCAEDNQPALWAQIYRCVRPFFNETALSPQTCLWMAKALASLQNTVDLRIQPHFFSEAVRLCKIGSSLPDHMHIDYGICFFTLGWNIEDRAHMRELFTLALQEFSLISRDDPLASLPLEEGYVTESVLFLCDNVENISEKEEYLHALKTRTQNWLTLNPLYPEEYGDTFFSAHVYLHASLARIILRENCLLPETMPQDHIPALNAAEYHINYALMLCKPYFYGSWPNWNTLDDHATEVLYSAACLDFKTKNTASGQKKLQKCFSLDQGLQKRARFDALLGAK